MMKTSRESNQKDLSYSDSENELEVSGEPESISSRRGSAVNESSMDNPLLIVDRYVN